MAYILFIQRNKKSIGGKGEMKVGDYVKHKENPIMNEEATAIIDKYYERFGIFYSTASSSDDGDWERL